LGTSRSFRAPLTGRWQAFVAALGAEAPDRTRAEFFNAVQDWATELSAPAIAAYGTVVAELYDSLGRRLVASERTSTVVADVLAEARHLSRDEGGSSADVFADRALATVLLTKLGGAGGTAGEASERWAASRGESAQALVGEFVGAVFRQVSSHYADREAGALVEAGSSATATADRTFALADRVSAAAGAAWSRTSVELPWEQRVSRVIAEASRLPEAGS